MKKIFTTVSATALAVIMSISVAAVTNDGMTDSSADVYGVYLPGRESPDTVAVDITWDEMKFGFEEGKKTWNPDTHTIERENGAWSGGEKAINLVNHSNVEINAAFAFRGEGDVIGKFTENALTLVSGKTYKVSEAPEYKTGFSVTGGSIAATGKVGTVTVTVSVPKAVSVSTSEELYAAAADSTVGSIRLMKNINIQNSVTVKNKTLVIDLNDNSLQSKDADAVVAGEGGNITVKNGCIMTEIDQKNGGYGIKAEAGSNVTVEKCSFVIYGHGAIGISSGNVTLKNCSISIPEDERDAVDACIRIDGTGSLTMSGSITHEDGYAFIIKDDTAKVICLAGGYSFDPTDYVDKSTYTVTEETSAGVWIVKAK